MHSIYVTQVFVDVSNVIVHLIHFTNIISDFMCALLPTDIQYLHRTGAISNTRYCPCVPITVLLSNAVSAVLKV